MQGENVGAYLSMLGAAATWQPAAGGSSSSIRVVFGVESDPLFGGIVQGDKPAVLLSVADAAGMHRSDILTYADTDYTLRTTPKKIDDGLFAVVELELVG